MIDLQKTFGEAALGHCREFMEDYDCANNLRMYYLGDFDSISDYEQRQNYGCCGFVDHVKIPFPVNGKSVLFGFNYGH